MSCGSGKLAGVNKVIGKGIREIDSTVCCTNLKQFRLLKHSIKINFYMWYCNMDVLIGHYLEIQCRHPLYELYDQLISN